ncbi:MAG: ABC transporter ATP-binding protein/permease [Holosporales bacterium]|jgi:subfamily B ATP-binding cassette protein MsbA|nr:ABC transporter ATP-binding protein/permease [Holosporales bacterium]
MATILFDPKYTDVLKALVREYFYARWKVLACAGLCMIVSSGCLVTSTKLIQPMVDDILISKNAAQLLPISFAFFCIFMLKGLCDYAESVLLACFGQRVLTDLQVRCFQHIICTDIQFFNGISTGELISRLTSDVSRLQDMVTSAFVRISKDAITVIGLVGVAFYTDPELACVTLIVLPMTLWPGRIIGRHVRKIAGQTQSEMGRWASFLSQCFQGIRIIKAYSMEDIETKRAACITQRVYNLTTRSARMRSIVHPLMELAGGMATCLIISIGGWLVIQNVRTTGALFSFLGALVASYRPLKSLLNLNATMQEGLAAAQRLYAILATRPRVIDRVGAKDLVTSKGRVIFESVRFSYREGTEALSDVSFVVEPGRKVALVGASGAGKSTLLSLLLRFYDPAHGRILIDGQDIAHVTQASLRRALSLVSQDISLFDDTVRANIAYGSPQASFETIQKAAKASAAHEFIQELPQGYDTPIGENGVTLSGGQRQRLSIARAMLKNAPILLLDEATSALDGASEQKVQQAINYLTKGRTTLMIAHRLSTILDADEIFVLDRGTLVERGKHEDLLTRRGMYAHLYTSQAFQGA